MHGLPQSCPLREWLVKVTGYTYGNIRDPSWRRSVLVRSRHNLQSCIITQDIRFDPERLEYYRVIFAHESDALIHPIIGYTAIQSFMILAVLSKYCHNGRLISRSRSTHAARSVPTKHSNCEASAEIYNFADAAGSWLAIRAISCECCIHFGAGTSTNRHNWRKCSYRTNINRARYWHRCNPGFVGFWLFTLHQKKSMGLSVVGAKRYELWTTDWMLSNLLPVLQRGSYVISHQDSGLCAVPVR